MSKREKIKKCFKEGQRGERHKGIRKIEVNKAKINGHLKKSIHNFSAMISFQKTGFSDWSASASFYCLYHGLLSLIAMYGFESRNQSCTFTLVEHLINGGKIGLTIEELREIYDKDVTDDLENSDNILDIRDNMQYSIKTSFEVEEFQELKRRTKVLFDKIRLEIENS